MPSHLLAPSVCHGAIRLVALIFQRFFPARPEHLHLLVGTFARRSLRDRSMASTISSSSDGGTETRERQPTPSLWHCQLASTVEVRRGVPVVCGPCRDYEDASLTLPKTLLFGLGLVH